MIEHSWIALRLAEQLRMAEMLLQPANTAADGLDVAAVHEDDEVVITADDMVVLKCSVDALAELCTQLVDLSEQLPDGQLTISYRDVASAAADDLSHGIMDPMRARLAARVLPIAMGWPALATALRTTDTHTAWDDLTVGEMLTCFFDADLELVERVLGAAELSSGQRFSSGDARGLRHLAAALEEHVPAL